MSRLTDPILRRPSADRGEKRVTLGNDVINPRQNRLTTAGVELPGARLIPPSRAEIDSSQFWLMAVGIGYRLHVGSDYIEAIHIVAELHGAFYRTGARPRV